MQTHAKPLPSLESLLNDVEEGRVRVRVSAIATKALQAYIWYIIKLGRNVN
jgi:hypothetical protein